MNWSGHGSSRPGAGRCSCWPTQMRSIFLASLLTASLQASQWILILVAAAVIAARLYLRLKIQKRKLLSSDLLMCAAWVAAVATAAFDIKFAQMRALDPEVVNTLEGYTGGPEDIALILRVSFLAAFIIGGCEFLRYCHDRLTETPRSRSCSG